MLALETALWCAGTGIGTGSHCIEIFVGKHLYWEQLAHIVFYFLMGIKVYGHVKREQL